MSEEINDLDIETDVLDVGSDSTLFSALSAYQNKSYSEAINTLMPEMEGDKSGIYANRPVCIDSENNITFSEWIIGGGSSMSS